MRIKTAFLFFVAAVIFPAGAELILPREAVPEAVCELPGTWRQFGTIGLSYSSARRSFDLALRKQGWRQLKIVELDRVNWKTLELWGRGRERILLQFWRKDTGITGFAWGELKEDRKRS